MHNGIAALAAQHHLDPDLVLDAAVGSVLGLGVIVGAIWLSYGIGVVADLTIKTVGRLIARPARKDRSC